MMWAIIFLLVIAAAIACFCYLAAQFGKYGFMRKIAGESRNKRRIISAAAVGVLSVLLVVFLGMMNAMICLIYLTAAELICSGAGAVVGHIRKKKTGRDICGICAIILTMTYLGAGWYFAHTVVRKDYTLKTDKNAEKLRIVQIADAHMGTLFDSEKFAGYVAEMQALEPDIVLITGDLVDDNSTREDMLGGCRALSGFNARYGVYFSYGNHDRGYSSEKSRGWSSDELEAALKQNGVVVLRDESVNIGDDYILIGREDLSAERKTMAQLNEGLDSRRYTIVMDHQPSDYDAEADAGVDLVLSGHTHGGQLIPITYVGEWIGANCRTYGHEKRGNTDFVVTSGIGDWAIMFKTGCRSEYVVIDIEPRK